MFLVSFQSIIPFCLPSSHYNWGEYVTPRSHRFKEKVWTLFHDLSLTTQLSLMKTTATLGQNIRRANADMIASVSLGTNGIDLNSPSGHLTNSSLINTVL